jgi:ATP synthase F1 gamma subunit
MKILPVLKRDMEFNKGLSSLIETLKTIAVSQYKSLEKRISSFEDLLKTIESFFEFIDIKGTVHPFLNPKDKPQAVIAVTSDTGFLGALNLDVINLSMKELEQIPGKLIVIGERGKLYATEVGVPFVAFGGIGDEVRYEQAIQLRDYVVSEVMGGSFGYLKVVYPRPVSFTVQTVETVPFLPFSPLPAKVTIEASKEKEAYDVLLESRLPDIVEYLVSVWMGQKLYEIFGLSRLAEFSARYVHLEESTQKLKEIEKKTQREYFRVKHELIDRNMRELFAARQIYVSR